MHESRKGEFRFGIRKRSEFSLKILANSLGRYEFDNRAHKRGKEYRRDVGHIKWQWHKISYFTILLMTDPAQSNSLGQVPSKSDTETQVMKLWLRFRMIIFWKRKIQTWKLLPFHKGMWIVQVRSVYSSFLHLAWLFCWEIQLITVYCKYIKSLLRRRTI